MGGRMSDEKVDAWMPLWIGSYLADTTHLSRDQHGGYFLLLMAYWRNKGPLRDDGDRLANTAKATSAEWRRLRPVLLEFFDEEDGAWVHGRAEKELQAASLRKASASSKAKAAAAARWGKSSDDAPSIPSGNVLSIAQALPKLCPTPSPIPKSKRNPPNPRKRGSGARFDDFWLKWPKNERKQDKAKCLDHWGLRDLDQVADVILADVHTKRGTEKWQGGHIEAPLTYLRGKRWEDDVTPNETPGGGVVAWDRDGGTIRAKAAELGLAPWDQYAFEHGKPDAETFKAFIERVRQAVDVREAVHA